MTRRRSVRPELWRWHVGQEWRRCRIPGGGEAWLLPLGLAWACLGLSRVRRDEVAGLIGIKWQVFSGSSGRAFRAQVAGRANISVMPVGCGSKFTTSRVGTGRLGLYNGRDAMRPAAPRAPGALGGSSV